MVRVLLSMPPSGDRVEFTGISMYRVSGDRLAELWDTRNRLGILTQINPDLGHRH